ncbi:hypothetical protein EDB80DRAFT_832330 [Ilyonectria destructans]|nr:hypothetical protein EDB80DRAFT_832330 [Ilyonectria destructans]
MGVLAWAPPSGLREVPTGVGEMESSSPEVLVLRRRAHGVHKPGVGIDAPPPDVGADGTRWRLACRSEISGQVVAEVASWTSQPTRDCPAAVGGRPSLDLASTYKTIADHRFGRFQAALVLLWKAQHDPDPGAAPIDGRESPGNAKRFTLGRAAFTRLAGLTSFSPHAHAGISTNTSSSMAVGDVHPRCHGRQQQDGQSTGTLTFPIGTTDWWDRAAPCLVSTLLAWADPIKGVSSSDKATTFLPI